MKRIFRNRIEGGKGGSQCVATKSMNPTAKGARARAVDFVQRRMGVWSGDEEEEGGEV